MSVYKELLDSFTWSFSRLTAYENCPYSWYRRYVEGEDGEGSFYADNGSAMHEVFDGLVKGNIAFEDAPSIYLEKFENIQNKVKQETMDKTFDSCINYLCSISEDVLDDYDVLASELEVRFQVGEYDFIGFIDLLLRDKDGNLLIVDHKSADPFLKKDGTPYAKSKDTYKNYLRQLSLYALGVKNVYGSFPKKLVFHHFKNDGKLTIVEFDENVLHEAIDWATGVIEKIYSDEDFLPITKTGFCYRLCDYRGDCTYMTEEDE